MVQKTVSKYKIKSIIIINVLEYYQLQFYITFNMHFLIWLFSFLCFHSFTHYSGIFKDIVTIQLGTTIVEMRMEMSGTRNMGILAVGCRRSIKVHSPVF